VRLKSVSELFSDPSGRKRPSKLWIAGPNRCEIVTAVAAPNGVTLKRMPRRSDEGSRPVGIVITRIAQRLR